MVAVRLSVGYGTCHHPFVIGWSKYRLGLPQSQWIVGWHDQWEFPQFFTGHWQSPWTALMAGICLPLRLCKETVKESHNPVPDNPRRWFTKGLSYHINKMADTMQMTFSKCFYLMKMFILWLNFHWILFQKIQLVNLGWGNGFVANMVINGSRNGLLPLPDLAYPWPLCSPRSK